MKSMVALLAFIATTQLQAQTGMSEPTSMVGSTRSEWVSIVGYITKAAEQMPEADYAFKPTPVVRSFGQLIGHLADGQTVICNAALAEQSTAKEGDIENAVTAKADLIAALRKSTELCNRAYAQPDAATTGMTKLFGQDRTRFAALLRNTIHDGEHYGNIVTYFRLKGMVPPSSQPPPTTTPTRE
jgi:uncharacterized damage-inducible protein DinB